MRIVVRYHAGARDLAGRSTEVLLFSSEAITELVLRDAIGSLRPDLKPVLLSMRFAANEEFMDAGQLLRDSDVVDVLPPVAGGSGPAGDAATRVTLCEVRVERLFESEIIAAVSHPQCGAVSVFTGVVRDHAEGKPVARLEYEAFVPLAEKEMLRIMVDIAKANPDVFLAAVHRVGSLSVGDSAVVVAASSAHRVEAIQCCTELIERIKATVPIWKKEWAPDGTAYWVNLEVSP